MLVDQQAVGFLAAYTAHVDALPEPSRVLVQQYNQLLSSRPKSLQASFAEAMVCGGWEQLLCCFVHSQCVPQAKRRTVVKGIAAGTKVSQLPAEVKQVSCGLTCTTTPCF